VSALALLLMLATAPAAPPPAAGPAPGEIPVDLSWSRSATWDDGLAEVARYDAHRTVYGKDRRFETILITVKEDFDRTRSVKADRTLPGSDLVTVLKLNAISRIQTENYPYDYLTSVFVRRDDPRTLVKLADSSQEWCGTTYKEVVTWEGAPQLRFHSYFDGEGDGAFPIDLSGGALLEEQLALVMRAADLVPGTGYPLRLFESLVANKAAPPVARSMTLTLAGTERLTTPAGGFQTRRYEIRPAGEPAAEPAMTFWIDQGPGRALVKQVTGDGRSLELTSVQRRDYWTRR